MKRKTNAPRVSHDQKVIERIKKDPFFASEYLKAAMEEDDEPRVLLIALRRIAEARGGIAQVARKAGVERESLHRALSGRGNPRYSTLVAVAKAVGLRLTVEPAA
jgi:probable addiction module antidote protein